MIDYTQWEECLIGSFYSLNQQILIEHLVFLALVIQWGIKQICLCPPACYRFIWQSIVQRLRMALIVNLLEPCFPGVVIFISKELLIW